MITCSNYGHLDGTLRHQSTWDEPPTPMGFNSILCVMEICLEHTIGRTGLVGKDCVK